jgi:hypothetical protein
MTDPFDLKRFLDAQEPVYSRDLPNCDAVRSKATDVVHLPAAWRPSGMARWPSSLSSGHARRGRGPTLKKRMPQLPLADFARYSISAAVMVRPRYRDARSFWR